MKKHLPTTVSVAIITTVTIFAWIFFEVYRILTTKPDTNIDPKILEAINPNLNKDGLEKIKSGLYYSDEELGTIVQQPTPTPEILVTPTEPPTETPEAQPTEVVEP